MYNPVSTYRIQFHKGFNFGNFNNVISYLKQLGITTVYASPVFEATPGSTHGYDASNPHKVNPEIGTESQWFDISRTLKEQGIGWLQDIVPNHMAFDTTNNWLMDTLEKGPRSPYASFFDIDWKSDVYEGRLMVPFLGSSLEQAIQNDELKIHSRNGRFVFSYYDRSYPLNPASYATVLLTSTKMSREEILTLTEPIYSLIKITDPVLYEEEWKKCIPNINTLLSIGDIQDCIETVNANDAMLLQIANDQYYRLAHWQETDSRINYRRFFTVNGLICLNIHTPEVFGEFHKYIDSLMKQGILDGVRIDHIDGLYDPASYLAQLRGLTGEQTYIIVEKILGRNEQIPDNWPVQGTTGYEFLAMVNNLLTNQHSKNDFVHLYKDLIGDDTEVAQQVREKKAFFLYHHMRGELENLFQLFMRLVDEDSYADMRIEDIKTVIAEFLIHFPVYRFYGNMMPLSEDESQKIRNVFASIQLTRPDLLPAITLLQNVLLVTPDEESNERSKLVLHFYKRLMQYTGPLMAKGIEDTLMYTYNWFVAHNEVGDSPEAFGYSIKEFHQLMKERQRTSPLSLNATSTHDTKRGEDVRARLNVVSDLPKEWISKIQEWRAINSSLPGDKPDANDEYLIYQTLIGSYPLHEEGQQEFGERLEEYLQKALREAKRHSNWTAPNQKYETTTKAFAISLLDKAGAFWKSFAAFHQLVADFGITNSIVQLILKFTAPGVPDIYQGAEFWDLSLVDPDNRRAVDYKSRHSMLSDLQNSHIDDTFYESLWESRIDGRIKLWLTHLLLELRSKNKNLFTDGSYIPLKVQGRFKDNILAFARVSGKQSVLVVVPLHVSSLCISQNVDAKNLDWKDARVILPSRFTGALENILSGITAKGSRELKIQEIFSELPCAVIKIGLSEQQRDAGILLHISSLASPYGIGDIGPEAKAFADFLVRTGQKFWQLLPVNPTEAGQGHSPYSAVSGRAGNILLISPDLLFRQGLLTENDLSECRLEPGSKTDYANAERVKKILLDKAWNNFLNSNNDSMQKSFIHFCEEEKEWLDDFALYMLLKETNEGRPWYEWKDPHKFRQQPALSNLSKEHEHKLSAIKWVQFIFRHQWDDLKTYCNEHGILLIGDLPFYISYDSADVWSYPQLFSLDEDGNRTGVAGVPPDAFSADGQLWGMPVFRWDVHKEQGYAWWIERLKYNRRLFDFVRLDHFRAFAAYWEVPAAEVTARNGEWKAGPGGDFFKNIRDSFGELPFVAEDLGDIDETVLNLRDEFNLPGMKVLQFAFGDDDFYESDYIPHNFEPNFIVYTGTHDNNTTLGWYRTEADDDVKERIQKYLGTEIPDTEIAHAFCRMAMASVAKTVVLPLQDVLGLDESARMNTPSTGENNWSWRLLPAQITREAENKLLDWTLLYSRKT